MLTSRARSTSKPPTPVRKGRRFLTCPVTLMRWSRVTAAEKRLLLVPKLTDMEVSTSLQREWGSCCRQDFRNRCGTRHKVPGSCFHSK